MPKPHVYERHLGTLHIMPFLTQDLLEGVRGSGPWEHICQSGVSDLAPKRKRDDLGVLVAYLGHLARYPLLCTAHMRCVSKIFIDM